MDRLKMKLWYVLYRTMCPPANWRPMTFREFRTRRFDKGATLRWQLLHMKRGVRPTISLDPYYQRQD